MPKILSPYKSKPRRSLRRLILLFAIIYVIFRIVSYLLLQTSIGDTLTLITSPFFGHHQPLECLNFDHGDTTSLNTSLNSIFNCNSPYGKCHWYHPAKFFHPLCGVGSQYAYLLEDIETMRRNATLWHEMPPIIVEWVSLSPENPPLRRRRQPKGLKELARKKDTVAWRRRQEMQQQQRHTFPRHNISMIHVHKAGGTSLVFAMGRIHELLGYEGKMHIVYPSVGTKGQKPNEYARVRNTTSAFLNGAVKYKSNWNQNEHTIFAVVRDPVERFISAIGQATGGRGSHGYFASHLSRLCLTEQTSQKTLSCFVELVKVYGTWVEVHFTPMVLEISFSTMYKDLPVAVFPFHEVPTLLDELDGDSELKRKDGTKKGHRKNDLLTNMKLTDYDEESLKGVCDIYKVDVLFLWHLGYATRCDDLVSFS